MIGTSNDQVFESLGMATTAIGLAQFYGFCV